MYMYGILSEKVIRMAKFMDTTMDETDKVSLLSYFNDTDNWKKHLQSSEM